MITQFNIVNNRLKEMHRLISSRSTGRRSQFASKLGLSESQLSNYLQYIRSQGIDVAYDYHNQCYYYRENYSVHYKCGFIK